MPIPLFFASPTGSPGLAPIDIDVDGILRPVLAVGAAHVSSEWEQSPHRHRKAQLLYAVRGVIHCEVDSGAWIVPPQCAVWIPGGLLHAARGAGEAQCYCLFVEVEQAPQLPAECCTVAVSPLLRELIFKAAGFPVPSALDAAQERLVATLLDELAAAPVQDLHLPMPRDSRLRQLAAMLLARPGAKTPLAAWASRLGMSVGRWRRQLHVIVALQRLAQGYSVKAVALELGYENTSGFVTMFRKAVGKPPARYLAERGR